MMAHYEAVSAIHEFAVGDRVMRQSDGALAYCVSSTALYAVLEFDGIDRTRIEIDQFDRAYVIADYSRSKRIGQTFDTDSLEWSGGDDDDEAETGLETCVCSAEKRDWDIAEGFCNYCDSDIAEADLVAARIKTTLGMPV